MGPGGQPMIRIKRVFVVGGPAGRPRPPHSAELRFGTLGVRLVPPMLFAGNSLRPGPPLTGPVSIRFEQFTVFQASGSAGGWVTEYSVGRIPQAPLWEKGQAQRRPVGDDDQD